MFTKTMWKGAVTAALGVGLFAAAVLAAVKFDVPFVKDLRDAFDS